MLSAIAAVNLPVDAELPQFDEIARMIADGAMDQSPTMVYEVDYGVETAAQNSIDPGIVEHGLTVPRNLSPDDLQSSTILMDHRLTEPSSPLLGKDNLQAMGASQPLEGDSEPRWSFEQSGTIDPMDWFPGDNFEHAAFASGFLSPPQFAPGHEHFPTADHSVFSKPQDLPPPLNMPVEFRHDSVTASPLAPVAFTFTDAVLTLTQTSDSMSLGQNSLLICMAYDLTTSFSQSLDLAEHLDLANPLDLKAGVSATQSQASSDITSECSQNALCQLADVSCCFSAQLSPNYFSAWEHGVEGGFVDIDIDSAGPFQTTEHKKNNLATEWSWNREGRNSFEPSLWNYSNQNTMNESIRINAKDGVWMDDRSNGNEELNAAAQDAIWANSCEEGGMIVLTTGTDSSITIPNAFPTSTDSTRKVVTSASERNIEIDSQIDILQSFELSDVPAECVPCGTFPPLGIEGTGSPNKMTAIVPVNDTPAAEEHETAKNESANNAIRWANSTFTIVVASLMTAVADRRQNVTFEL